MMWMAGLIHTLLKGLVAVRTAMNSKRLVKSKRIMLLRFTSTNALAGLGLQAAALDGECVKKVLPLGFAVMQAGPFGGSCIGRIRSSRIDVLREGLRNYTAEGEVGEVGDGLIDCKEDDLKR